MNSLKINIINARIWGNNVSIDVQATCLVLQSASFVPSLHSKMVLYKDPHGLRTMMQSAAAPLSIACACAYDVVCLAARGYTQALFCVRERLLSNTLPIVVYCASQQPPY